jgi:hypothetical protein
MQCCAKGEICTFGYSLLCDNRAHRKLARKLGESNCNSQSRRKQIKNSRKQNRLAFEKVNPVDPSRTHLYAFSQGKIEDERFIGLELDVYPIVFSTGTYSKMWSNNQHIIDDSRDDEHRVSKKPTFCMN